MAKQKKYYVTVHEETTYTTMATSEEEAIEKYHKHKGKDMSFHDGEITDVSAETLE